MEKPTNRAKTLEVEKQPSSAYRGLRPLALEGPLSIRTKLACQVCDQDFCEFPFPIHYPVITTVLVQLNRSFNIQAVENGTDSGDLFAETGGLSVVSVECVWEKILL